MSEFIDSLEEEGLEILAPSEEKADSEYAKIVKAFENKEIELSFSFLKEFYKSPRHGIRYILNKNKPRKSTVSMIKGSICDDMLTDHFSGSNRVEEKYITVGKVPTTENQIKFCEDILSGIEPEEAFKNNYNGGSFSKTYEGLKPYIEAVNSGKECVNKGIFDRCKVIFESLIENEEVVKLLSSCDKFQNHLSWEYEGWKNKGFTDAEGNYIVVDYKFTEKLDPDKFERDILYRLTFLQTSMYSFVPNEGFKNVYLLVYDNDFNYDIMKIDVSYLAYGQRLYKHLINKLEECIKYNLWDKSYSFHNFKTVREVYVPKWVKGFNTEINED